MILLDTTTARRQSAPGRSSPPLLGPDASWCPELVRIDIPGRLERVAPPEELHLRRTHRARVWPFSARVGLRLPRPHGRADTGAIHTLSIVAGSGGTIEKHLDDRLLGALPLDAWSRRGAEGTTIPRIGMLLLSPADTLALKHLC